MFVKRRISTAVMCIVWKQRGRADNDSAPSGSASIYDFEITLILRYYYLYGGYGLSLALIPYFKIHGGVQTVGRICNLLCFEFAHQMLSTSNMRKEMNYGGTVYDRQSGVGAPSDRR